MCPLDLWLGQVTSCEYEMRNSDIPVGSLTYGHTLHIRDDSHLKLVLKYYELVLKYYELVLKYYELIQKCVNPQGK